MRPGPWGQAAGDGKDVLGSPGGLEPPDPVSKASQLTPWTCIPGGATPYIAAELRSLASN